MLAPHWTTARLAVDDAVPSDVDTVAQCLAESADVALRDPTFGPAPRAELEDLVARSQAPAADGRRTFQMQMLRRRDDGEVAGYWHVTAVPRREGVVGVSILLIRPAHRRQGFGEELVSGAAAQLAGHATEFWARVFLRNPPAIEFWSRQGFVSLAQHQGTFVRPPEETPSIILCRRLRATDGG